MRTELWQLDQCLKEEEGLHEPVLCRVLGQHEIVIVESCNEDDDMGALFKEMKPFAPL
jgi:hypothetical protein